MRDLSPDGRRLVECLAAAEQPLSYETLRHVLRVTEEDMIQALGEAVRSGLVRRIAGPPPSYEMAAEAVGPIRESLGPERLEAVRRRVAAARSRAHGGG